MPSYGSGKDILYGGSGITQPRDTLGRFAGGQGVEWTQMESMSGKVIDWAGGRIDAMIANAQAMADEIREYMQDNAPWEDRTGDARESLQTAVTVDANQVNIWLSYGPEIFYGYFLEHYTYGGISYAIIGPTIQEYAAKALSEVVG
jgi:hypothetical protein